MQLKNHKLFEDKRGVTFGAFIEVMLISMLFVVALGIIGTNMNSIYGENKDLTFGLATNDTLNSLKATQASMDEDTATGQSSFTSLGLFTLTTLPKMLLSVLGLIRDFVLGGWIRSLVNLMNLGEFAAPVILVFQILYIILLIFILVKIITRVGNV